MTDIKAQKGLEITEREALLNGDGYLNTTGWARQQMLEYNRKSIRGGALRIKEWDYYLIVGPGYAVALTIDDNSYMSLDSVSLLILDTERAKARLEKDGPLSEAAQAQLSQLWEQTTSPMGVFPMGKRNFPSTSVRGDVTGAGKHHHLKFENPGPGEDGATRRHLTFHMDNFKDGLPIDGEITLLQPKGDDTIVVATPFKEKNTAFYYNQKIDCMIAEGSVTFNGVTYPFSPEDSFACLDWGRGVWTYKNTWYWGSAFGLQDGHRIGFNIGYGFGDNPASENIFFLDGVGHKLTDLTFNIPMKPKKFTTRGSCCGTTAGCTVDTADMIEDYMSPWTFTSKDGRFEMDFVPVFDRASKTDVGLICSDQHQVFGYYTGTVGLDDGSVFKVDHLLGFAEKVFNKW